MTVFELTKYVSVSTTVILVDRNDSKSFDIDCFRDMYVKRVDAGCDEFGAYLRIELYEGFND